MMLRFIVLLIFTKTVVSATDPTLDKSWEEWKSINSRSYEPEEEIGRRIIWEENLSIINEHNTKYSLGKRTFTLQMNHLGDMTNSEINAMLNGFLGVNRTDTRDRSPMNTIHANLPDTVDWREKGYVTEVKDQKNCGSCYAFSATGSLEGQHFKKTGKLVSLSEQQFIDCSDKYGNYGCGGGLMDNCFLYVQDHKGNDLEECYPYEAKYNWCRFNKTDICIGATDSGFVDLPMFDENALKNAVATVGPISVAIDASKSTFHYYKSGVYNEPKCSPKNLDHGVLAVGYGTDNDGGDYWLVKNSWGASWGEQGYIKMSRNANNQCGIATQASYPKV